MKLKNVSTRAMFAGIQTRYCGTGIYKQNLGRSRALRLAEFLCSEELINLAQSQVYWDEVISIEYAGIEEVFDLTVENLANFEANGLIVHNSIEQDADVVAFIYREEYYAKDPDTFDEEKKNVAEILVAKQRNGPTGTIKLAFLKEFTRFENYFGE